MDRPSLEDVYSVRIAYARSLEVWRRHASYGDAHGELIEIERCHEALYRIEAARLGIDLHAPAWSAEVANGPH